MMRPARAAKGRRTGSRIGPVAALFAVAALTLTLLAGRAPARAETADFVAPDDANLTVTVDSPAPEPFAQEMILLRIHGVYTVEMTLEHLDQPAFADFAWMQLGRDKWAENTVEGRHARSFDRVMALFPRKAGTLTIPPFTHRLTLLAPNGSRVRHDVVSTPVTLTVRAAPAVAWWLPARALRLTDTFDKDPAKLGTGETTHRTVTLEADGVPADLLPPMPDLRDPGLIAFPDPEERTSRLTREGPVSTVVWRWTIRSKTGAPATLPAIRIPWFDTVARKEQVAELAGRAVARADGATEAKGPDLAATRRIVLPLAAATGLLGGLALLLAGTRVDTTRLTGWIASRDPTAPSRRMRKAARTGDIAGFREAALRWARQHALEGKPEVVAALADLGATAYAGAPPPRADVPPTQWLRRIHGNLRREARRWRRRA